VGILSWILVGLIAGLSAKLLMPGHDPGGLIVTTVIGMAGSSGRALDRHPRRSWGDGLQRLVHPGCHVGGDHPAVRLPAVRRGEEGLKVRASSLPSVRAHAEGG
jgi:hypothetical protein